MAGTKETKEREEGKQALPVGHPQAGYISPDLSERTPAGPLPPEEQEWHDARDEAQQAEKDAVEEHEDNIAELEREQAERDAADNSPAPKKAAATEEKKA